MSTEEKTLPGNTVREVVERAARDAPERPYLLAPESGRQLRYAELRARAADVAERLASLGLGKGDTVSFLLGNGPATVELILGSMYGGHVCAPLNPAAGLSQLAYVLEHSRTGIVFVSQDYEAQLREALASVGRQLRIVPTDVDLGPQWPNGDAAAAADLASIGAGDDAMLMYTSGTTGKPKGVLLTHSNVLHGGRNAAGAHGLLPEDRGLCVLPLCHINAQAVSVIGVLVSGGTLVMPHRFSVSEFWEWIAEHGCTWFSVVPTIIASLLHGTPALGARQREALGGVRFGRSASAPLPPALHEQFEDRFGIRIVETMGITEAAAQILANPMPPARGKLGSAGVAYGNEVRIAGPGGETLAPCEQGEILVRGPNVMRGYLRDAAATAAAIDARGWLHTGDLGHQDEDGFVFVTGRLKELIIKGGENISPREIDDALFSHPAVVEAGAVGVPDDHFGEDVVACVVVRDDIPCTEQELIAHCAARTGEFKAPRAVYFVSALPKGPTGKVLRHELAKRIEGDLSRRVRRSE
jgi:acyl-CoA synthetase (AMP-forming)/AMP-acid ligase II